MTSGTNSPILRLSEIGVSYTRRMNPFRRQTYWALKNVSFDLFQGETLGVIGRNGVGKTTLLRVIAGLISPDRGRLRGARVTASLLSLQVGFLPHLTGRENGILSGLLLGMRRREVVRKMPEIAAFAELGDFLDQPVNTYSSGMRARLGFAVAFHADPDIILADEVLGVGDAEFRKKSEAAMREQIRSNKTVVLVSHNAASIRQLCDRAVWLENGESRAQGETKDVLDQYLTALEKGDKGSTGTKVKGVA